MRIKTKHKLFTTVPLVVVLVLMLYSFVAAGYIGPNRTHTVSTTSWMRWQCRYRAVQTGTPGYCDLTMWFDPNQSSCPGSVSNDWFTPSACGSPWQSCSVTTCGNSLQWPNGRSGCNPGETGCAQYATTTTVTDPSATIGGAASCALNGDNGWCRSGAGIAYSAAEPVSGYLVTFIEGDSGVLCDPTDAASVACTWSAPGDGVYSLNAWAHTTYGDTSLSTTTSVQQDGTSPVVSLAGGSPNGSNGWYISSPTVSASASDNLSGVASATVRLNGGAWSANATVPEGVHTVDAVASDMAGNASAIVSGTYRVDATPPTAGMTVLPSAPDGSNGWYVTAPVVTAVGSDTLSGINTLSARLNGGAWSGGIVTVTEGAAQTVDVQTSDMAGNTSILSSSSFNVDLTDPTLLLSVSPSVPTGANGWYVTTPVVSVSGSDGVSGLAGLWMQVDGGAQTITPATLLDGTHTIAAQSSDVAGRISSDSASVRVDTTDPDATITPAPSGYITSADTYTVAGSASDATSGLASLRVSFDGATWTSVGTGGSWTYNWDVSASPDGVYTVYLQVTDVAGNVRVVSQSFNLNRSVPSIDIQDYWIWNTSGTLSWRKGDLSVYVIEITVKDPTGKHPSRVYRYGTQNVPSDFYWDRILGDGAVAQLGSYPVTAKICDVLGRCVFDSGVIEVAGMSQTPTAQPTFTVTPTGTALPTQSKQPTPEPTIIAATGGNVFVPAVMMVGAQEIVKRNGFGATEALYSVSALLVLGMLVLLLVKFSLDPRPAAVNGLSSLLRSQDERSDRQARWRSNYHK